jgi:two-component system chemotaxis sensor kinase CheA
MQTNDPMLEVYLYENGQLLEQLETFLLEIENGGWFQPEHIREIFRIMHTIKGSSAMMGYDAIMSLSHALEDLFAFLRDNGSEGADVGAICDMAFVYKDFVKAEMDNLQQGIAPQGDASALIERIKKYTRSLSGDEACAPAPQQTSVPAKPAGGTGVYTAEEGRKRYEAVLFYESDCRMENIRAFAAVQALEPLCSFVKTIPEDLFSADSAQQIVTDGLKLLLESSLSADELQAVIKKQLFVKSLDFSEEGREGAAPAGVSEKSAASPAATSGAGNKQSFMSVNVNKLDSLMNLVGEIVITEATVVNNPDALGLVSESFSRACQMLNKLTRELQDIVMSIRMVPVATVFHNMRRIVRDMSVKTNKKAELVLVGEETEVDKNIADTLGDPLMHIVRNAMDHGLESDEERARAGKNAVGRITLEARNIGNEVVVIISDDGRGLNREKLIRKGREQGLITKPDEEITDREAYALVFGAGFSTKDQVTEYSGRGVGLDAAREILHKIGGVVTIDSHPGRGTTVTIRIPLTLAIMQGMLISAHAGEYILPMLSIRESFRPKPGQIFRDPDQNEMVLIRENCYPIIRLNRLLKLESSDIVPEDGILILIEANAGNYCLLADKILGEQQIVIKPIPGYLARSRDWLHHVSGCTLMGNGKIQLILNINTMFDGSER